MNEQELKDERAFIGENVYCFECGEKIFLATEKRTEEYNSSGMCLVCEQKALGESDPVSAMFEIIIERLDRIEKLLKERS